MLFDIRKSRVPGTRFGVWIWLMILALVSVRTEANCRGEIEGPRADQIGTIVLFSARAGGPDHVLYGSEFWALTGPYDTGLLRTYPVEFSPELMDEVNSWDWRNAVAAPIVLDVRVDAEFRNDHLWLIVKEIFRTKKEYDEVIRKYPDARRGTCGSLFRRW